MTLSKLTHRQCWRSRVSPRGSSDRVLTFYGHLPKGSTDVNGPISDFVRDLFKNSPPPVHTLRPPACLLFSLEIELSSG